MRFHSIPGRTRYAVLRGLRAPALRVLLLITAALWSGGCASSPEVLDDAPQVLRIKGSDTMLHLVIRWAEEFMKQHPDIAVYAEGGGSATGIRALIDGDVHLSSASRSLRPDEVRQLLEKQGSLGLSILTARDALSVYLHPSNPVTNLGRAQLKDIFAGRTMNWKQVGGTDLPITVIGRQPNSGTFLFFEEHVLDGEPYSDAAETVPTTAAVIRRVQAQAGAIGYGGLAYGRDVTLSRVEGVEPTAENVRNGSYPIARYLYFFASEPPRGKTKLFIDWVLSDAGQRIVQEIGYIPLWELRE
ncbi:MAG: phosphate ABC transporter substrate-binding protein [Bacteroidota bacterium]|nr:phosphate ABC transporter substrate-binding protein [Bacteroidota bacterium]